MAIVGLYEQSLGGISGGRRAELNVLLASISGGHHSFTVTSRPPRFPVQLEGQLVGPDQSFFPRRFGLAGPWWMRACGRPAAGALNCVHNQYSKSGLRHARSYSTQAVNVVNSIGANPLFRRIRTQQTGTAGQAILILHNSPEMVKQFAPYPYQHALNVIQDYQHIVCVSDNCRQEWESALASYEHTFHYIPNCTDEHKIAELLQSPRGEVRAALSMPPDAWVITVVASLQPRKGQDVLAAACASLYKELQGVHLYFVGPDKFSEWTEEKVFAVLRSAGVAYTYVSPVEDALPHVYASDLLVLPSRAEALPLVILEAMALGTPVVASSVAGIPEMVIDEVTGWTFESEDHVSLAEKLSQFLRSPSLAQSMASEAKALYWRRFSRAHYNSRWASLLSEASRTIC